jgi:hypothetical protein
MFEDRSKQVYNVFLNSESVGFFQGDTWGDAQRKGASSYNEDKDKEDKIPWEKFNALWVNPKHYEQHGITFKEDETETV